MNKGFNLGVEWRKNAEVRRGNKRGAERQFGIVLIKQQHCFTGIILACGLFSILNNTVFVKLMDKQRLLDGGIRPEDIPAGALCYHMQNRCF